MSAPSTPQPGRSLAGLAVEALAIQDACNLSGLVISFARVVGELRAALPASTSTRAINEHPIVQLWVDKLASLAGVQMDQDWTAGAYRYVYRLAGLTSISDFGGPDPRDEEDRIRAICAECPPEHRIPDSGEQPDDRLSQCIECGGGSSDPNDVHTCPQGEWGES